MDQPNPEKDYYQVLGAGEGASPREIERLYKRLARLRHPDRGGSEDEMKALNEAYQVLHDQTKRQEYDSRRSRPAPRSAAIKVTPTAPDVGIYGQFLSALLCLLVGLMLLFLVHFNGLWFLWPMSILATGVVLFGVIMAHSAMTNARGSFASGHPARRFRAIQEIGFWGLILAGGYVVYLVLTTI